jgi:hypothetical protein
MMADGRQRGETDAEDVAVKAFSFLAADPERLGRFLAITGLGPQNLRGAAGEPGFLAGVLTHIAEDEALLVAFAADANLPPERVARAHVLLAGPPAGQEY